eukprot:COSAG06_NODE_34844_length_468_cov_1.398374_1_plen_29_part_01
MSIDTTAGYMHSGGYSCEADERTYQDKQF